MRLKWFPWRFIVRRVAQSHGFLDPIALLGHLHRFAQPAEVAEPIELLRAGVVLHARGLINSRVIQHNLDWIWPYWVEKQFNPKSRSFIPRAFSITHINLTHRNWTAVGLPNLDEYPIIDPRGLITPFYDGWSLDCWIASSTKQLLLPSRIEKVIQTLDIKNDLAVQTTAADTDYRLVSQARVTMEQGDPVCQMVVRASACDPAWLVIALRPYNPEGISFIHEVSLSADRRGWTVDGSPSVRFSDPADRHHIADYREGDVSSQLFTADQKEHGTCNVGMLTAAALFKIMPSAEKEIRVTVPLPRQTLRKKYNPVSWQESLKGHCRLAVPDTKIQFLYDAAVRTLILLSPHEAYPGPFTYKRFWFRDAAFIVHGLLCAGLIDRAEGVLEKFTGLQSTNGYFHSQEGEWDANGEVLWIMQRFCACSGKAPRADWLRAIRLGAEWIANKRLKGATNTLHCGLLPAGFSAEHLGLNDYYYWDDFWGVAGLQAAARLLTQSGDSKEGTRFSREADAFYRDIEKSIEQVSTQLGHPAIPASPYRRLDAGAIGSLAISYPLQICSPDDIRLRNTVDFLLENCMVDNAFFQDMTHSGLNAYLTLHIAQVLLRQGVPEWCSLIEVVASMASPTGQWPEAIHPRTRGGCMGDGQHAWAAAEWIAMIRNCLVREEGEALILASGVSQEWFKEKHIITFEPAPTAFGTLSLSIEKKIEKEKVTMLISWQGKWHDKSPAISVRPPGFNEYCLDPGQNIYQVELKPKT